jgi:glycosyltransferase involved in cell wall biosynthesis
MVPAYNEEEVLEKFYEETIKEVNKIKNEEFEILFINDGSKDNTLNIIKSLHDKDDRVKYVNLSRNYGKEIAMSAGFDYVKGDAAIIMDADLQDPPSLIPIMIKEWRNGDYDDVYARRRTRDGESFFKKKTSSLYYRILSKFAGRVEIQIDTGDFRLLSRKAINAIKQYREAHRYTKGMFSLIGFRKKEVLFDRDKRVAGETKWNYFRLVELAIEGFTSFTTAPLKLATFLGTIVSVSAFVYAIYIVINTLIYGNNVEGYPSLMVVMLFLGGVQLITLGILGEYIGRIFNETKNRPLYFINEYVGEEDNKE